MRKFFVLLAAVMLMMPFGFSQNRVTFTENFNSNNCSFTRSPQNAWMLDTTLSVSGKAAWGFVPNAEGDSIELISPVYDLSNYAYAYLRFAHICKVSDADLVTVEYRENYVGSKWTPIPFMDYRGESSVYRKQRCWHHGCYSAWLKSDLKAQPDNSWWKVESFDVSSEVSYAEVQFKFKIKKGSTIGTNFAWGWFIDNFELMASASPIQPPVVQLIAPYTQGTVYGPGPYTIYAKAAKRTIVPLNTPLLRLSYTDLNNKVTYDSILMTAYDGDSLWKAAIPQQNIGTQVSYTVYATDSVGNSAMTSSGYTIGREWGFDSNCVALVSIDTPMVGALSGKPAKVYATIENRGLKQLLSAVLEWSVNGVRQSPVKWTGVLPEGFKGQVSLGTYMPTANSVDTLDVWVHSPNGEATNNSEDTIRSKTVYACATIMSGTYKVGPTGQYATIQDALDVLRTCGVTGNVTLAVEKGTYPGGMIEISDLYNVFPGTDGLVIESATGKAEDVVFTSTSTSDPIVLLSNVRNVTLRNLTFVAPGDGLTVTGDAYNVEVNGCRLFLDTLDMTTGYWGMAIYQSDADKVRFINNEIVGAYYSMYIYGTSSTNYITNITVTGNRMHAAYYYGIYSYYTDYDYVSDNIITNRVKNASNYFYAYRMYYSDVDQMAGNRANISAQYAYGMYNYYFNKDSNRTGLVCNNEMLIHATSTAYGIYTGYSNAEYTHNTVVTTGSASTERAVYCVSATAGYRFRYYNNLLNCSGNNGYPMYLSSTATLGTDLLLDYNNYYAPAHLGYAGTDCLTLTAWVSASKDQNATNVNPPFIDLTKDGRCLYYTGMTCPAVQNVPTDILGKPRTGSTAMGCYSPAPVGFDAALLAFIDWKSSVTIGQSTPVKVRMMNTGTTANITSAQVNWTLNGIAQTPYKWTGNLAPFKDTVLSIGGYIPVNGVNNIVVWLSNQNGNTAGDSIPSNDTIRNHSFGCKAPMNGTYRIGLSKSADFPDVKQALEMLASCGADAPVVFALESGKYAAFAVSGYYPGISTKNTLTIKSISGKASDVEIYDGSPVVTIEASHVRLENVTVNGVGSSYGIQINNTVSDIQISHCTVQMDPTGSATSYGIYCSTGAIRDSIWLVGNHVDGGYYGIYFYNGTSSAATDHGVCHRIDSNVISNPYYMGLYGYYCDMTSLSFNKCYARAKDGYNYFYGLECYYCNISRVEANYVDGYRDYLQYCYSMYIYYSNYTYSNNPNDTTLFINNEVRSKATSTSYGMYIPYGRQKIVNNSVYVEISGTSAYGIYGYNGSTGYRSDYINNNVVLIGGTSNYPIYAGTANTYSTLSGNNYYHAGGTNLLYNGGARTTLAAVKNYDATATNVMPEFIDVNLGLFIRKSANSGIDCPVSSYYAPNDIDGEPRTATTIRGCHNPTVLTYNASLKDFTNPTSAMAMNGTRLPVSVTLLNRGDSTITSADIYWEVNGVAQTSYKWSGTLTSDKSVVVNLDSFVVVNGSNVIKAYVHLNDSKDVLPLDDTISMSVFGCSTGALSGKYAVGANGAFTSLADALTAVSKCGIGGPVTFELANGTYADVAVTGAFPGGSHTNSVTITSASGNREDVVINGQSYALDLKDVSNLHFSNVTIGDTMQTEQAIVVENTMKNVTFTNCNIYAIAGVSTTSYAGVYRPTSSSFKIDTLRFTKCNFYGGYQNIHLYYGGTSSDDGHLIIENCNLHGAMYYGFNCPYPGYYVLTALHNDIHNHYKASTYYGFRIGSVTSYLNIDSLKYNRVVCDASGTNYGFYVGQTVNYHGQLNKVPAKIHNNLFIVKGSTGYGINYMNLSSFDFRHNTFYVSSSSTRYGYYLTNTSTGYTNNFYDNLVYLEGTTGTAHCMYHSSGANYFTKNYFSSDYNDYYNELNNNIGMGITDINTWYTTTGNDLNSMTEKVYFKDIVNLNLHTNGARGIIPVDPEVGIDMEGKLRMSYTNAGCYNDFIPSNYDAGVTEITAPKNGETTGQTADCKVKIRNMGKLALASVTIQWKVNGTLQTPYKWQAPTAADTITYGGISPEIKIGSFTVPSGKYEIVVWTEDPNGFADLNKANDTAVAELIACVSPMAGTYTIGGSNADFDTPEEAFTGLLSCGVKAPVVLKIASGDYDAFTIMGTIPGTNDTNTVTVTSVAGKSESVTIGDGASTALKLSGVSHLVFKDITIGGTGSANSVAVEFANYNEDVLFHHCNLYASVSTTNSSSRVVNYANSTSATNYLKDVRFIGNEVRGGYYGFYLYYAGGNAANCKTSAAKRASVRMDSNYIYDQYYYPLYSYYYTYIPSFSHNTIRSRSGANYNYGAYFYNYNLIDSVVGNHIHINVNSYAYSGIRLYYYINYTSTFGSDIIPAVVANNEIISVAGTTAYGIYAYYYVNACIVNNSVYCKAPTNYGLYLATQSSVCDLNIQNNIFMTEGGATNNYIIYCSAAATLTTYPTLLDYNDYYTTSTKKNAFYCGSARTFANWQSTYNMDGHSVEVDPNFSNMPEDLSITNFNDQLKCNRNRQVMRDINNDARTTLTVMGAYSTPLFEGYDLQLEAFAEPTVGGIQCFPNSTPVKLALYNMGTYDADFAVNPVTLYLKCESDSVNFVKNVTINSGSIKLMKRDTFEVISNMDITYAGMYKLTAWLEWTKDQKRDDDTLKLDYYVDKTVLPYDNNFTGTFAGVATNQAYGDISWEVVNSNPVLNPVFGTGSLLFRSSKERGSISQALFTSVSLQGTYNPHLYFWYAHDNKNPYQRDQMEVRISQDGGATFKTLQTLYRYDAKCTQPTWKEYKMDLSKYSTGSCIIIAFTAYSYGGGDQTVDRVKIIAQQDMQVKVDAPSDTDFAACNMTGRSLTVYLENLTSQEVPFNPGDSVTVEMSGASNFIFKQALSGRLENREIDTLVLSPIDYVGGGQFDVMVYVNSIDSNAANDTAKFTLNLNPDLAVTGYDEIGFTAPGDTVYVGFTMKNTGNLEIVSPFNVKVVVNGVDTITELVTASLKPGDTLYYKFRQGVIVPNTTADQPYYLLDVYALLPCDADGDNDSVRIIGNVNIVDNGILSIITPAAGQCAMGGEMAKVEVRLFNNGNVDNADSIVVTAVIDSAGAVYATLTEKVAPMYGGENRNYTFRQQYRVPRLSVNGAQATYNVTVYLTAIDGDVDLSSDTAKVEACVQGGVGVESITADRWTVGQNVPNPAAELTRIPYTIPEAGVLTLRIMGMNGQVLYREDVNAEAGSGDIRVNLSDLAAGVYYYSVEYRGERVVKKMNVVR